MDEMERNDDPSLPPDYVSLAQLQERWIKKQQEKKLKEKEEEEREERETRAQNENQNRRGLKSDAREKVAGLSLNNGPRRRMEKKSGLEIGVIEDGRKGEEVAIVGSGNGNRKEDEKLVGDSKETDGGDGREGVEIVNQNEVKMGIKSVENPGRGGNNGGLKGIEEIVSVNMVEVLPDVRTLDFRGGFRRNRGNSAPRSNSTRKEYRVRVDDLEKKMENEKGYGMKWRERRKNDESCSRMKENRATGVMKDKKLEPKKENKVQDEISEVCNEIDRNKTQEDRTEIQDLNDNQIEMEEKSDNEVFKVESVKSFRNGYRRNWNGSGRHGREFSGLSSNDWGTGNMRSNLGDGRRYGRTGRFEGRWDAKERESGMMWVKKEETLAAEVGSSGISEDQA